MTLNYLQFNVQIPPGGIPGSSLDPLYPWESYYEPKESLNCKENPILSSLLIQGWAIDNEMAI